jgi:competence protein ComEA
LFLLSSGIGFQNTNLNMEVELNTADAKALCTLPGVGPGKAQAILDYRAQHGPFAQVEDAAQVSGITRAMVDSWAGQAYVR